jgi:hypothetical protein
MFLLKQSSDSALCQHIIAVSMAICMPALDGFSLAHLDAIDDALQVGFWKERMWGTMFWGIEILVNGVGIDKNMAFVSRTTCFVSVQSC